MQEKLHATLKQHFGYDMFRASQQEIIENVLVGKDTFVLMPTGGGKSLCYQLPSLLLPGLTLVISPLIALMKDQVDGLRANGIEAEFINSSLTPQEISRAYNNVRSGKVKMLYVAPERMALSDFKSFLHTLNISLVVIDEAHCISEWGHDFRPEYRNLSKLKLTFANTPIIALTATATKRVREDIIRQLSLEKVTPFISSFDRPNLSLRVINKKDAAGKLVAILKKYQNESVIIYCFSRKDTEKIAGDLNKKGFKAAAYHAGLAAEVRNRTQERFVKDQINIIVATIAFGMGIDKSNVRLVVHYTFPKSLEGYYQEIGRAGRDGLASECIMFYTYADARKHAYFTQDMDDLELKRQAEKKLKEVIEFAELRSCRRAHLLTYFGEDPASKECGNCDCCNTEKTAFDATIITQKILSAILRTGNRFGGTYIINILKGKKIQRIKDNNHDELAVFGLAKEFDDDELKEITNLLIERGLIDKSNDEYGVLSVTGIGQQFLDQRQTIQLAKTPKEVIVKKSKYDDSPGFDEILFEKLRILRRGFADHLNVPAFHIFNDATLQQMAIIQPDNKEEMLSVSGVGEKKLESFGNEFLQIIRIHKDDK